MRVNYLLTMIMLIIFTSCESQDDKESNSSSSPNSSPSATFSIASSNFTSGGTIPTSFTLDGSNVFNPNCSGNNDFPALSWQNAPTGTQSFVLIVEDPDGGDWVHLNLYDIPSNESSISELTASGGGLGTSASVTFPFGTVGQNSWSQSVWGGPCPPSGTHEYVFKIYALDISNLGSALSNTTRATFESTYSSNILGSASISGYVSR